MNIRRSLFEEELQSEYEPRIIISTEYPKNEDGSIDYIKSITSSTSRKYVYQGELVYFYVILPKDTTVKDNPWLLADHMNNEQVWKPSWYIDVCIKDTDSEQSALSHFHADAHAAPALGNGTNSLEYEVMLLDNGDLVIIASTIISISTLFSEFPFVCLQVFINHPPEVTINSNYANINEYNSNKLDDQLHHFVKQHRFDHPRLKPIILEQVLEVIQPLKVTSHHSTYGRHVCISVNVLNCHDKLTIKLQDLDVHLNRTRYTLEDNTIELATIPLDRFFQLYIQQEQIPIILEPEEQQNFIISIEPQNENLSPGALSRISRTLHTLFSIKWSCDEIVSPILLQQKITWNRPPHYNIMASFRNESPVPLNHPFTLYVTVSNTSDEILNITLAVLPVTHPFVLSHESKLAVNSTSNNNVNNNNNNNNNVNHNHINTTAVSPVIAAKSTIQTTTTRRSVIHRTPSRRVPDAELLDANTAPTSLNDLHLLCLESSVQLGEVKPNSSQSASLHFVALREGLLVLNNLFLVDESVTPNRYFKLDQAPTVFAMHT